MSAKCYAWRVALKLAWCSSTPQNVRDLRQPFGGVKASGTGREGGEYSFEVFAEMKNVCISMGDHPIPKWGV
ncbi:5-carboxymethyl-2-hydroxymuconate semialdehyde dehydrogenase [Escherichia coli]|uniref:5-carboxymethyl-2-hydroxymuconate semialdehyde dehydrogenase n=1 Tax=Escherichia coli TaxID=562 RepID=A0A376RQ46_ECOLX|nr:5-carboxymethyl-2-hydroxymuconate semialdehyde dehydrogenase [Escherichia coli]